jgi:hypothetical protein
MSAHQEKRTVKKRIKQRQSTKGYRWPLLVGFATVLIAIGAITVISRQSGASAKSKAGSLTTAAAQNQKYVKVRVAGQDVQVDPQTGQMKSLTPEEARRLADGMKRMLNKSSDGLVKVQNADGSVSMDLQGRFQNVTVARVEGDGTLTQSCIDQPQQAASFFGIDPALMGIESKGRTNAQKPARISPAKKSRL